MEKQTVFVAHFFPFITESKKSCHARKRVESEILWLPKLTGQKWTAGLKCQNSRENETPDNRQFTEVHTQPEQHRQIPIEDGLISPRLLRLIYFTEHAGLELCFKKSELLRGVNRIKYINSMFSWTYLQNQFSIKCIFMGNPTKHRVYSQLITINLSTSFV
jgi:hypothetical protein